MNTMLTHEDSLPTSTPALPPILALDPIHSEAAARELALAQRLSTGQVYFTARESGTKALTLLCRAMGLTEREIHVVESFAMHADKRVGDYEAAREATGDFALADEDALADRDPILSSDRDLRPAEAR